MEQRNRFTAILLAATVAAGGLVAFPAAAGPDCVGLEIQPARAEQDLHWAASYDVTVRNCTSEDLTVTVSVTALGHDLDGAPEFFESDAAEAALTLSETGTFTLKPGKERVFAAEGRIPSGQRSLYAGVAAEFAPVGRATGTSVDTRSRVASMLLMRGPKPWRQEAEVVDINLEPRGDGSYTVNAAVEATGNVHINPTGKMDIRQDGVLLDTVKLDGGTILPGFKRRLTGAWTPPKELDGKVRLTAEISDPPARGSTTIDFSDGEADARAGQIISLIASEIDGGAYLEVTLRNTGSIPLTPNIEIVLADDQAERAREHFPQPDAMQPGEDRTVVWRPELPNGTYTVTARATQDGELLDEKVTGLRLGAPAPPFLSEGGMSRWLILALAILLLIVVMIALLLVVARRRREEDEKQPPPVEPARELTRTGAP